MSNSWKKYGGIYKSDKYNNIGVGTMVADQVLIRQRVITSSQIAGSLYVGENTSVGNDLHVTNKTTISGELYSNTNAYIGDKLYFNRKQDISENYVAYISGSSRTGRIGVGTISPTTFFDINVSNSETNSGIGGSTVGNTITDVLTVRNNNNRIRNIIAQNVNNSGVVVDTSGDIASIEFYNGDISDNTATPSNSIISDTNTQSLSINTMDSHFNSSNDSKINSINNLTITSGNITNINSITTFSKRVGNEQLLNGTVTIYDNSATVFLPNYYEESTAKSGNAISLVSSDSSSNVFLNIITPNNNGFSIGGGAYPRDNKRTMGTIGLLQTDISYIPTQVIVSNDNMVKYKTSMGINTYCPESNKYVMDINGPTRIGNGEIHKTYTTNFEQNSTKFFKSSQDQYFGAIVGTPYESYLSADNETVYKYNINTTTDGGNTWTTFDISDNVFSSSLTYDKLSIDLINDKEMFVISSTSKLGYINTTNEPIVFNAVEYNYPQTKFNALYATKTTDVEENDTYKILIGGDISNNGNNGSVYYYDKANTIDFNDDIVPSNHIDASCSEIKSSDGRDNISFFVGKGIEKVDFTGDIPISVSYDNYYNTYNLVAVYDTNYVIVTGKTTEDKSIISYTHDAGVTWTDSDTSSFSINHPYPGFNHHNTYISFSIKSIDFISETKGIALGTITDEEGLHVLIIYTTDGSKTWNRVDPKIFYSAGLGHLLEKPSLNSIHYIGDNIFTIIDNATPGQEYTIDNEFASGDSSVLQGFFPNIFDTYSNQVIDVNGGMNVDGKIIQF